MRPLRLILASVLPVLALSACNTTQKHELVLKIDPKQQEEFLTDKPAELRRF